MSEPKKEKTDFKIFFAAEKGRRRAVWSGAASAAKTRCET